jgi:thiosulfate/3-mercaptopyruvate sulfurtransferase
MSGLMHDSLIVQPAEVEAAQGRIRVIDCTVRFETRPVGASIIHSGRDHWLQGHIPGAAYLHMVDDLSDPAGKVPFTIAPQAQIERVLSDIGIKADDTVVLYGAGTPVAVTRAWWVLDVSGVSDVRIMDGGWQRWVAEGRPIASGEEKFERSDFRGIRRQQEIADSKTVLAAIDDPGILVVNALTTPQFEGSGGTHYGRPGRIPGSVSCPANTLLDPQTGSFVALDEMRRQLAPLGSDKKIITYCGGGIAASATLFALRAIGHKRLALYDNSLLEWSADPTLPMQLGQQN